MNRNEFLIKLNDASVDLNRVSFSQNDALDCTYCIIFENSKWFVLFLEKGAKNIEFSSINESEVYQWLFERLIDTNFTIYLSNRCLIGSFFSFENSSIAQKKNTYTIRFNDDKWKLLLFTDSNYLEIYHSYSKSALYNWIYDNIEDLKIRIGYIDKSCEISVHNYTRNSSFVKLKFLLLCVVVIALLTILGTSFL